MMESPKKHLDVFDARFVFSEVPPNIDKHLEFVEISSEGEILLGSSNLNGCYWTGSIWYFLEPSNAPQREKVYSGLKCESGICDGKFLSENKVIIGEDLGMVSILHLHKDEKVTKKQSRFTVDSSRSEHDHAVLSVSVSDDKKKAVTGSMDKCIKVWDVTLDLTSEHTYRPAHKDHVTCVAMRDFSNLFVSCSLDGAALLWDTRLSKPAQVIYEDVAIGLKSVAWSENSQVVIGSTMGELCSVDTRNRGVVWSKSVSTPRPIHRIVVNSTHNNLMAVCADDMEVRVLDIHSRDVTPIYSDVRHRDYVRGLTWVPDSDTLISCGWDRQVLLHQKLSA